MEPDDPPPKVYGFKEREFKRDNAPASASPPPPSAKELAIMAGHADPAPQKGPPSGGVNRAADPNDAYAVLRQNRAVEQKAGLNEVDVKPPKTRRKRDFWQGLAIGYVVLVGGMAIGHFNLASVVACGSLMVFYTIGLWWIMFHILSDY